MEAENNPLEAVRSMMIDTVEKSRTATQSYFDLFEKTVRSFSECEGRSSWRCVQGVRRKTSGRQSCLR
jgi:hypothetical protein